MYSIGSLPWILSEWLEYYKNKYAAEFNLEFIKKTK